MTSGDPNLIAVEPRVVKEVLVDRLFEEASRLAAEPLPQDVGADLDGALAAVTGDPAGGERAAEVARLGYAARRAETDAFARAREPMPWLADELQARGGNAAKLSAELALGEPVGLPDPADERAALWRVPGPGGHVRHWLASRAAGPDSGALRRAWLFGFYLRCCAELMDTPTA